MIEISELKFDKDGLIPAVVVDAESGDVLMLAYMNEKSLNISIDEGRTFFWSRSRNEIWQKGKTSGNIQHIVSIRADCDKDSLVVTVKKDGPACHTGAESCFFEDLYVADAGSNRDRSADRATNSETDSATATKPFSLNTLHEIVEDRKENKKPGSYTTYLFEKGLDKILKKLGEETTEVIIAAKSDDKAETIYELADLTYHALVLMTEMGITLEDVKRELASRHIGVEGCPLPEEDTATGGG
ncbi:MAG: bifunctional phosphoribosyl-AMP cyclohydrolase/phosphoribosyl-ATP diphosphatase HisIE [Oscillospiraceae bacterium]|nr:bifunctional phosphoribosyl-AMP cyclohydrolase/phosphoribosyl-ATP diphosphatase HisIE [Oscillospiraceae bacterium]